MLVGGRVDTMAAASAAAAAGLVHGEILIQKKQGLLFIETCKFGQQYLVFGTYYLRTKRCYNPIMI